MKKLLIVDDEKNIRLTLRQCFTSDEYIVDVAVNGEEALKKIKEEVFDLVLLDIKMPGLTGMEVLEKVRMFNKKINIIIMTAYGSIEKAVDAMKLGAVDFISKPFTPIEIRDIVEEVFYREVLEQESLESFDSIVSYAKKCIIEKKYDKAEEYLKKSITIKSDESDPHNMLGVVYEVRGNLENALREYKIALKLNPEHQSVNSNINRINELLENK